MTQPQGANLKTIEWGGPGAPRTVLLVHGLTGRAEGFRSFDGEDGEASTLPQASPVVPGGFLRWICADRRPSGAITGRESGIPEHARDFLALVGREGLEQVVLVGHLVGARVGVYLAAHHPARLRRLVLIDGGSDVTDALLDPSIERFRGFFPSREAYLEYLKNQPPFKNRWDEHLEHYFAGGV